MDIRPFTLDDYDGARRVWDAVPHIGRVPRHEVEQKLARDPHLFLVAVDAGEVVGAVMGSSDGRRGWIMRLAVHPSRQGRGIARTLVTEVEQRLVRDGISRVNLLTYEDNEDGKRFWERAGYEAAPPMVLRSKVLAPDPSPDDPSGAC